MESVQYVHRIDLCGNAKKNTQAVKRGECAVNYTEYMNLRKPEEDDFYSVEDINENAEKIDKKIKETDQQMKKNVEKTRRGSNESGAIS